MAMAERLSKSKQTDLAYKDEDKLTVDNNLDLVRRCLTIISRIAARGASSPDPDHVRDTLFELSHALQKCSYDARTLEPPASLGGFYRLLKLHQDLDFIDSTSTGYTARDFPNFANTSTRN